MSDPIRPRRKRPGCGALCGGSCLGALLAIAIIFSITYSRTGIYRPHIPPPKPLPSPNAFDDYIAAGKAITSTGGTSALYPSGRSTANPPLPAVKRVIDANRNSLRVVRAAFQKVCRVPADRDMSGSSFDHMSSFREIGRLLSAESRLRSASGDYAGAFESGLDAVELGADIVRGGYLIHGLVRSAIQAIGQVPMLDNLERIPLQRLSDLIKRMQAIILSEVTVREIAEEERNVALTQLLNMDNIATLVGTGGSSQPTWWEKSFGGMAWHFVRDQTIHETEEYYAAALPELDKPPSARKLPPEPQGTLSSIMIPIVFTGISRLEGQTARNRIFLCALALRQFHLENHRFPTNLAELKLDQSAIVDPFTGKPLRYANRGATYELYSAGPDTVDDAGIPGDETVQPMKGDLGIRPFHGYRQGSRLSRLYRKVPYMKPPNLPPGAPPLNP